MTIDKRAPSSKMFINIPIHSQEESCETPLKFQFLSKRSRSVAFLKMLIKLQNRNTIYPALLSQVFLLNANKIKGIENTFNSYTTANPLG